jgi:hypothetical protein
MTARWGSPWYGISASRRNPHLPSGRRSATSAELQAYLRTFRALCADL